MRLPKLLLLSFCLALCAAHAAGQAFRSASVLPAAGTPQSMAAADFNRDGTVDLVYQDASTGGNLHVMAGAGNGTFREVQQVALPLNVGARITAADLDGNGSPDLIVGYYGFDSNDTPAEFGVLLNRGDGTFGAPQFSTFPTLAGPEVAAEAIAVADFDGDGHADFIFTASAGLVLMRGDGSGRFTPRVISPPLSYGDLRDVWVGDFNEDGKPDVAMDGIFGVYYALNQGGGTFGPVTTLAQVLNNPPPGFGVGDVDRDGHQDIMYGHEGLTYVAYGRGNGTFSAPAAHGPGATPAGYDYLAIRDVNGDGRPDLVTSFAGSPVVQLQNAAGQFSAPNYASAPAVGDIGFLAPVYADFDGDGVGDVITGASGALVFSKGSRDGSFNGARATLTLGNVLDLQPLDLNRDGFPDVALIYGGGGYYGSLRTFQGDGTGAFSEYGAVPAGGSFPFAGQSSVADFNGDGAADLVNAGYLLRSDGNGNLQGPTGIAPAPTGNRTNGFTAVADFNEDGIPDAVNATASFGGGTSCTLSVGISTGANAWTTQQLTLPYANGINSAPICAGPTVAADLNGDGHADLATASFAVIYVFFGDGHGRFTAGPAIPIGYTAGSYYGIQTGQNDMEAADLDRDGKVDLVVPIADKNMLQIFYGRGDGTFEPAVSLPTAQDVRYVTVADMDRDGVPDMVLGGHALVRILHGLGGRRFEATPSSYAANPYPQKVRVADINRDGNPDLLVPNGGYSSIREPGRSFTVLLNGTAPISPDLLVPSLACTPEPSTPGQAFGCTASFVPAANALSPMGAVLFRLDGAVAGTAALAGNRATLAFPSTVAVGSHGITADFAGDTNFRASRASTTHVVSPATATIVLSGPARVAFGQAVPLAVALGGSAGVPTGTVTFREGSTVLAQVASAGGAAAAAIPSLPSGTHLLQAAYSGDAVYAAGQSNTLTVVVDAVPTTLQLAASPTTAPFGLPVMLVATVSASAAGAGSPLGAAVQFFDGASLLGTAAMDAAGNARLATTALALGVHALTAHFAGNTALGASDSAAVQVTVTGIRTATTLLTSPNPSYPAQAVTLAATVTALDGTRIVTGTVRFLDGTTVLGSAPLDARGSAALPVSSLAVGSHPITAQYDGAGTDFLASQSGTVVQVVLNSSFTLAVDPPELTLQTQHHATLHLRVTPVGLFNGTVTLRCGDVPAHTTCLISPQSVTLSASGGTQTAEVTLDTSDVRYYAGNGAPLLPGRGLLAALLLPLLAGRRLPRGAARLLLAAALFGLASASTGCSGRYPASVAPGTYAISFVGQSTATPVQQTATLTLRVTP